MTDRLDYILDFIRTAMWPVPAVMALAGIALSWLTMELDSRGIGGELAWLTWRYAGGAEGARSLLTAIAGSAITVAAMVFSVTTVVLTMASQQFGPRLLRSFLRDRGNQFCLGAFVATFLFALVVLPGVSAEFIPQLSLAAAFALAALDVAVLIYFIHHVATVIVADNIIAAVAQELNSAIDHPYPEDMGGEAAGDWPHDGEAEEGEMPPQLETDAAVVASEASGYLQVIAQQSLVDLARDYDVVVRLLWRPGNFIVAGAPLALVAPASAVDEALQRRLRRQFVLGRIRTPIQDVEFAVDQLVQMGIRALSPGINDAFTAVAVIDWLAAALCRMAGRPSPSKYRTDDEGRLRVVASLASFTGVLDAAFHQLRQSSRDQPAPLARLLEAVDRIGQRTELPAQRQALRHHAEMLMRAAQNQIDEPGDLAALEARYRRALHTLAGARRPWGAHSGAPGGTHWPQSPDGTVGRR